MTYQVYLVVHEMNLNHLLSLYLQKEGLAITSFVQGEKACKYIDKNPHMWIVDSGIPDIDGYQILNEVKEKYPETPVIMISERSSNTDRVIALEIGCDDYLPKPFLPKELALRAKKMLERTYGSPDIQGSPPVHRLLPYRIDELARIVQEDTAVINLTAKEFDLLLLLAKNPFRTFSREQILKYVWNEEHFGSDRSVDDLVRRLRRKMSCLRIESVYGYGYRLLTNPLADIR
ncbi:two component transcriptional regulator, winged helix family [Syntrophobotulus glycolicus DSM 8271]|uniref:Stage 0 sporulation protein A homolog n=1 Tax=Syntrophobotulus glycolicus (strain DSM 8271 / FlGlyR) TaxID=645991 RepID=F0SU28_SYNGF|nr:response regulator transcription factor [Syntrophobotulus glycolicus]ADY55411.1 two component transcriptional regulator, winged helix family [Syntrophobotulus glycolicus DSM 8271]